jgi:hypothetical protein
MFKISAAVKSTSSDRPPLRPRVTSTSAFLYSQIDVASASEPSSATRQNGGVQVTQPEEARGAPHTGIAYSAGSTPRQLERLNEILDSAFPPARPTAATNAPVTAEAASVPALPAAALAPTVSAREPRDVATMSDREVVEYLLEVLPPDYQMPSVHDCGYNVYQALRAIAMSIRTRQAGQGGAAKAPKKASRRRTVPSSVSGEAVSVGPEAVSVGLEADPRAAAGTRQEPQPRRKRGRWNRNASVVSAAEDVEEARRTARLAKRQRVVDKVMDVPFM